MKALPNKNMHERAFSLMEMLIVVSIIAVLVALLFPAVNAQIQAARATSCLNNLHTLYVAHSLYSADNDFTIVQGYGNGYTTTWTSKLAPYLSMSETDLRNGSKVQCPVSYVLYNASDKNRMTFGLNPAIGMAGNGISIPLRLPAVNNPSQIILFADSGKSGNTEFSVPWNVVWAIPTVLPHSRGTKQNAVFLDGHCAPLGKDEAKFKSGTAAAPWTVSPIWWSTSS